MEFFNEHVSIFISIILTAIVSSLLSYLAFRRNEKKEFYDRERKYVDHFIDILSNQEFELTAFYNKAISMIPNNDFPFEPLGIETDLKFMEVGAEERALFSKSDFCAELHEEIHEYQNKVFEIMKSGLPEELDGLTNNEVKEKIMTMVDLMEECFEERSEIIRDYYQENI